MVGISTGTGEFCRELHPVHALCKRLSSGVEEGDRNVPDTPGSAEPLVVVGEPAGVHEGPAFSGRLHWTVVADESATSALVIEAHLIERNI